VAEQGGTRPEDVRAGVLRGRVHQSRRDFAQRLDGDHRVAVRRVGRRYAGDRLEDAEVPVVVILRRGIVQPFVADNQDGVTCLQPHVDAAKVERVHAVSGRVRHAQPRPQRVPRSPRGDRLGGLEGLRQLVLAGDAHYARPRVYNGFARCAGRGLDGERQVRARRDRGAELVADGAGQLQDGAPLRRRAQVAFVGDALLVKGQHVHRDGPRIEERLRRVIVCARGQPLGQLDALGLAATLCVQAAREHVEIWAGQRAAHRFHRIAIGADAIREARQAGPVVEHRRRGLALAAATGILRRILVHRPPCMMNSILPFSGRFGSLSSRAISSQPIGM